MTTPTTSILSRLASPITTPPFLGEDLDALNNQPDQDDDSTPPVGSQPSPPAQTSVASPDDAPPPNPFLAAAPPMGDLLSLESDQAQENANAPDAQQDAPQAAPPPPQNGAGPVPAPSPVSLTPPAEPMPLSSPEAPPPPNPYAAAMSTPPPGTPPKGRSPAQIGVAPVAAPSSEDDTTEATPAPPDATQVRQAMDDYRAKVKAVNDALDARLAKAPPSVARRILGTIAGMFAGPLVGQLIIDPSAAQENRTLQTRIAEMNNAHAMVQQLGSTENTLDNLAFRSDTEQDRAAAAKARADAANQTNVTNRAKQGEMVIPLPVGPMPLGSPGEPPPSLVPPGYYQVSSLPGDDPNTIRVRPTPATLAQQAAEKARQEAQAKNDAAQAGWGVIPDNIATKLKLPTGTKAPPDLIRAYGELAKAAQPTEAGLALQAAGGDPNKALDLLTQQKIASRPPSQNSADAELDRVSGRIGKPYSTMLTNADAQLEKIADARAMINGNAEAQALGVPKVLTALVSGQGSGVRITQPELNAIARARGVVGDVQGWLKSISGQGRLTAAQQQQLTQILDDVKTRLAQKRQIASDALDSINNAASREEILKIDNATRKQLSGLASARGGSSNTTASPKQYQQVRTDQNGQNWGWSPGMANWEKIPQ